MVVPDILTVSEAAEILRISTKTMHRIIQDGDLPIIWVRGSIRISSAALHEYISAGGVHHHDRYR